MTPPRRPRLMARVDGPRTAITVLRSIEGGGAISDAPAVPADLAALRTETEWRSPADHHCPLCDCLKNGWAEDPNMTSEWCEDPACRCHE